MVELRPFRGWRYNPSVVGDLASVICPPYDIIDKELEEELHRRSPHNAVYLEGAERPDWNAPASERYAQAAQLFQDWQDQKVLNRDQEPSFYLMRHSYMHQGRQMTRTGLIGCVGLEDYQRLRVLRHEYTQEPAVQDRVSLMDACNANFSPIMSLYRDPSGSLSAAFDTAMADPPLFRVAGEPVQETALWKITDDKTQARISDLFKDIPVFLADGHHRYEAALRLRGQKLTGASDDAALARNYVMMTLFEFNDPGLLVLPYHRVVAGLSPPELERLRSRLNDMFQIQDSGPSGSAELEGLLEQVADSGSRVMGVAGLQSGRLSLLTLKETQDAGQWGPLAISEGWILEEQVLKPILGDAMPQRVDYAHDHQQALDQVSSGKQQLAFLLKPFPMDGFEAVVGAGHVLPRKSTFFYPKLPTGLVINQLEGAL
ncbi:MAG: hypothetical protein BZY80_03320 [SAR202 cluster bacterium Io17-Chloro-G2]|nr:MAG: hypothetical protein BZY80_03320 [SAR202 cluster bacterium Io17-Chloro-G2]